jgi:hypothetical protein
MVLEKIAPNRDSIPGPSIPYRVAAPTELLRPALKQCNVYKFAVLHTNILQETVTLCFIIRIVPFILHLAPLYRILVSPFLVIPFVLLILILFTRTEK